MAKKKFKSPGVYTREADINIVSGHYPSLYCEKCLSLDTSSPFKFQYCINCKEENRFISKEERRNIKIEKLLNNGD